MAALVAGLPGDSSKKCQEGGFLVYQHSTPNDPAVASAALERQPGAASGKASRRGFIKASAASLAAAALASPPVFAGGSDRIRIGLVGCGGRGSGAAADCVRSCPGVELVALGDLFKDRLDSARRSLKHELPAEAFRVSDDTCFVGFDAYRQVIACDVDLVLLATPAHFRPIHLKAAVEAGKHVFIEKPVAVDPVGARSVIASSELAAKKNLAVVAGAQRRHDPRYREIMKRIHDGAIGELVGAQCHWYRGYLWSRERKPEWSDMEWQVRNFLYFTWLSGDCIVETLLHNIDVVNWAFGGPPASALGMGGRQVRTEAKWGSIYDHFAVEYVYSQGVRTLAACREMPDCVDRVSERIVGTKGVAYGHGVIEGENPYRYQGSVKSSPYVLEHVNLIESIRSGNPLNEGRRMAESNLTAIMGRMSAYSGQEVTWDFVANKSQLDLSPAKYEFCELAVPRVAMPGQTKLI
jgi:predicted dehydrogenase